MYALIVLLSTGFYGVGASWVVINEGFATESQCEQYVQEHRADLESFKQEDGKLYYHCDTLKDDRIGTAIR